MTEKFKDYFVSQTLTKAWMNSDGKVSSYSPIKEKTTTGNPTRFYHRNLLDESDILPSVLDNLDRQFNTLTNHFKTGDYKHLFAPSIGIYSSILLQYERTPFYKGIHETFGEKLGNLANSTFLNGGYNWRKQKENGEKEDAEFLLNKIGTIYYEEMFIYDLERVYLHAPEGTTFLLGPNPMNLVNPLMEEKYIPYDKNRYELYGTMIIWPITPTIAVCLYDYSSYVIRQKKGVVELTKNDVDLINRVQIYNSKFSDDFVYAGDNEKTVKKLKKKQESRLWLSYNDEDKYPFSVDFSFVGIKADIYSNYAAIEEDPRREFVRDIQAFDDENLRGASENDLPQILPRRFAFANDKIFGEGRWQAFLELFNKGNSI